jgi:hypothetical protein
MRRISSTSLALAFIGWAVSAATAAPAVTAQQADSLFQRQDWSAAHRAYVALTAAEPTNGRYWYRRGYAEYQAKDYQAAVQSWTKAEAIGHNATVMYNLAVGHALLKDENAAFDWLDKAAAAGFGQEQQLTSDPDLASLHDDPRWAKAVAAVHATAAPCESAPEWHQFDFWIGEWEVRPRAGGPVVGHSSIQKILGQCVIFENWTGTQGGSGKSFNSYDAATKQWRQFWVDDRGTTTEFTDGHFENGVMRFVTHSKGADGRDVLGRLSFYDVDPNHVRQWKERSTDGGTTWTTDYDFSYERKK